jgi:hypothetical protein
MMELEWVQAPGRLLVVETALNLILVAQQALVVLVVVALVALVAALAHQVKATQVAVP